MKTRTIRFLVALAVFIVIAVGFVIQSGVGTLSAPGFKDISILCPLGALTTMLASKTIVPRAVYSIIIALVLIVLFARAFCGWVCPVPLVERFRDFFSKKSSKGKAKPAELTDEERSMISSACKSGNCSTENCKSCAKRGEKLDARHYVLGGALLSTAIFGFPVFCLICPIGLIFATVFLVINLFGSGDVTWSLLLVPAILILELFVFRKWCHTFCPLGALMSLVGKANKTFVPTADPERCLETSRGVECGACRRACPEGIDLHHPELSEAAINECTKCRACVDACPAHAITMPFLPSHGKKGCEQQVIEQQR